MYFAEGTRLRQLNAEGSVKFGETLVPSPDGKLVFRFSASGLHLDTRDSLTGSLVFTFSYNENSQLIAVEDVDGNTTRIDRDGAGNPMAIVAPGGQYTSLAVGPEGYLESVVNPAGESHSMLYSEGGLLTYFTDARNNTTQMEYDELGHLQTDRNAVGGGWELAQEKQLSGHVYRMTTAEGRKYSYKVARDDAGRTRTNTYPDGTSKVTRLVDGARYTIESDGTETYTQFGTDPRFGIASPVSKFFTVTTPGGLESTFATTRSADLAREDDVLSHTRLESSFSLNGNVSSAVYDVQSRTWSRTSPEGRLSTSTVDRQGRVVDRRLSGLAEQVIYYNWSGRIGEVVEGGRMSGRSTMFAYYENGVQAGLLRTVTDAESRLASFEYDDAGRVVAQILPDGRTTRYGYDRNGNLTDIVAPKGNVHRFHHTLVDQKSTYLPPGSSEANAHRFYYNLDKQLEQIDRPDGKVVDYVYGGSTGKLDSIETPLGDYTYVYSTLTGQLSEIVEPSGNQVKFGYDGLLPIDYTWSGEVDGSVNQIYNNDFQVAERCVSGAACISFLYDRDLLLTRSGELVIDRELQKGGLVKGTSIGRIATTSDHNLYAEVSSHRAEDSGSVIFDVEYVRDRLGRITKKIETIGGQTTTYEYQYDDAGRLGSVSADGSVILAYSYDLNGNRTLSNGVVATFDEEDRLTQYGSLNYAYTANGELLEKTDTSTGKTTTYDYDVLGNLRGVVLSGGTKIEYAIDGLNRRIGKRVNGVFVEGFLYKDQPNPIAQIDQTGSVVARFVYGHKSNIPSYMLKNGKAYRTISDHLGSPRLVVDTQDGSVAQQMDYDAWGNIILDTNPGFQPFGFAGGIYDQLTKLTRFGARDYDAEVGRWTTKDPIGFDGGDPNLYAYVANNPINFVDPHGLFLCAIIGGMTGEVTLGMAGGTGIAGGFGLGISSEGVSFGVSFGIGGGGAVTATYGGSVNVGGGGGGVHDSGWHTGTSVSVSGGTGVWGGQGSLSVGTDGLTGAAAWDMA